MIAKMLAALSEKYQSTCWWSLICIMFNDQTFITPTQRNQTLLTQYESYLRSLFQVEEEKNVYDIVNEDEYSEIVRQRQDDDWIVDDGEVYLNSYKH